MIRIQGISLFAFLVLAHGAPALADATVKVSLWDKLGETMEMEEALLQADGRLDVSILPKALMGITLDQQAVPAGKITFKLANDSRGMYHEMVVAPLPEGVAELPFDTTENRIVEAEAQALGEGPELAPRTRGEVTLELAAGTYVLFCNLPGHFASGMWTLLTVTP